MISYVTLGTNDLEKANGFYDALFSEIGAARIMHDDHMTVWGKKPGLGMFSVIKPYNGEEATVGNGSMAAIILDSPETVAKLHAKALALGGTDEGAPGAPEVKVRWISAIAAIWKVTSLLSIA